MCNPVYVVVARWAGERTGFRWIVVRTIQRAIPLQKEIAMSAITDKMSAASGKVMEDRGVGSTKKGERFRCDSCGMELQITADCHCKDESMVHFHCCGH